MSKPRNCDTLCNVLSVDPEKVFQIKGEEDVCYKVSEDGYIMEFFNRRWKLASAREICNMIQSPELIMRSTLTIEEFLKTQKIRKLFPKTYYLVCSTMGEDKVIVIENEKGDEIGEIYEDIFPSLKDGEEIILDYIFH